MAKREPYVTLDNGVVVNTEILALCAQRELKIVLLEGMDYPSVVTLTHVVVEPLHIFVWKHFNVRARPLAENEIIHHRNHKKVDARITNLVRMLRSAHAGLHLRERQKFALRRRQSVVGFYTPRAVGPWRSVDLDDASLLAVQQRQAERDASVSTPTPTRPATAKIGKPDAALEELLAAHLPRLLGRVGEWDSGRKIPPAQRQPRRLDRLMGIRPNRKGCTHGEVACVLALILHGYDRERAAAELGIERLAIEELMARPAVALAGERWHTYGRLPRPSSKKRLGRFVGR